MPIPKAYTLPFFLLPLALAVVAWLLAVPLQELDAQLFQRLLIVAHLGQAAVVTRPGFDWCNLVIVVISSILSYMAGFNLGTSGRVFAAVQIFAALIILQFPIFYLFGMPGHPLGYALTVAIGILGGYAVKRSVAELPARFEAQYYELIVRNRELQETRLQLVKQDEVERRMLAADLHDQVLNDLKALKQKIAEYGVTSDSKLGGEIDRHLTQAMEQVREVMDSLCPSVLEHLGLVAAVEDCLRRGAERGGFKIRFKSQIDNDEKLAALSIVEQSLIYRLVQESVTNICKHAQASTVKGAVELAGEKLTVSIGDDGKGIEPAKSAGDSRGLRYMRQRADLIGATISWRAAEAGKGTVVEICLDLTGRSDDTSADH